MPRGPRKDENSVETLLEKIVVSIAGDRGMARDSMDRIRDRVDAAQELLNGRSVKSKSADPFALSQMVGAMVEEYIYSKLNDGEYKDLGLDLVDAFNKGKDSPRDNYDRDERNRDSGRRGKSSMPKVMENYFAKFSLYLRKLGLSSNPSYSSFTNYVNKFDLKKECEIPIVGSTKELFAKWEEWNK